MSTNSHHTREGWLIQAVEEMRPWFKEGGTPIPEKIMVSIGFTKYSSSRAIGQCWDPMQSLGDDKVPHIFISPDQTDEIKILDILLHELIHASVGCECGHRGAFKTSALKFGLAGKMTATYAEEGSELHAKLTTLASTLGPMPHIGLRRPMKDKVASKWIRLKSRINSDYKVVISPASFEEHGAPVDPWGEEMIPTKL